MEIGETMKAAQTAGNLFQAYAYRRVSGKAQLEGDGFERQKIAIERYAAANNIEIVHWFDERAISGKTEWEDRPAWSEMITSLNGVRTIIIERLDRLARDLMVQEHIIVELKRRQIDLHSTEEPDLGSDEPSRVLMRQIMGAIAQFDRTMIVRKMRGARDRIRGPKDETTGKYAGKCEGRKAYGDLGNEAQVLTIMRDYRASGLSFQRIAESLNQAGMLTRYGKLWSTQLVHTVLSR